MEAEVREILNAAISEDNNFVTGWLQAAAKLRGEFNLPSRIDVA